jgi:hypothetical protein
MIEEFRASKEREKRSLSLCISGCDVHGEDFQEEATSHDISDDGISFFLQTPIWNNSHLTIQELQNDEDGETRHAMVVRIRTESSGQQLVAARFD